MAISIFLDTIAVHHKRSTALHLHVLIESEVFFVRADRRVTKDVKEGCQKFEQ